MVFLCQHMEQFDPIFYKIFQYYKPRYKSKANDIALAYILFLQISLLLLLGSFFLLFFGQMKVTLISNSKALGIYSVLIVILIFRNWIYYTGKKRKVLNTKITKGSKTVSNIWIFWIIPTACLLFSFLLIQRL